jgi:hypothetical protein
MPLPVNISASRAAAILGLSNYQTPVTVWLQIMESREPGFCARNNYELPVVEYSAPMRWGHAFESAVIELAEQRSGEEIICREEFHEVEMPHTNGGTITCHIDGEYRISENLHEGKTTSIMNFRDHFGEPGTDQVPVEYQLQCQHQMICTGAEKVILSVLVFPRRVEEWEEMGWKPINDCGRWELEAANGLHFSIKRWANILNEMGYFHQYEITANPELHALMLQKYSTFWTDHVLTGTPPVPMCVDDIKALVREPIGTIIADERVERLVMERDNIMSEIGKGGSLSKRAEELRLEILKYMTAAGAVPDDESRNKFILRGRDGKKLASYGADKNGRMVMR